MKKTRTILSLMVLFLLSFQLGFAETSETVITGETVSPTVQVTALIVSDNIKVDGAWVARYFNGPFDLTVDINENIYVMDGVNPRIWKFTPQNEGIILAGSGKSGKSDGLGANASFKFNHGITNDDSGNIYLCDTFNNTVRKITQMAR